MRGRAGRAGDWWVRAPPGLLGLQNCRLGIGVERCLLPAVACCRCWHPALPARGTANGSRLWWVLLTCISLQELFEQREQGVTKLPGSKGRRHSLFEDKEGRSNRAGKEALLAAAEGRHAGAQGPAGGAGCSGFKPVSLGRRPAHPFKPHVAQRGAHGGHQAIVAERGCRAGPGLWQAWSATPGSTKGLRSARSGWAPREAMVAHPAPTPPRAAQPNAPPEAPQ